LDVRERLSGEAALLQRIWQRLTHGLVIVDDGYRRLLAHDLHLRAFSGPRMGQSVGHRPVAVVDREQDPPHFETLLAVAEKRP